jgi:hypothetical protein
VPNQITTRQKKNATTVPPLHLGRGAHVHPFPGFHRPVARSTASDRGSPVLSLLLLRLHLDGPVPHPVPTDRPPRFFSTLFPSLPRAMARLRRVLHQRRAATRRWGLLLVGMERFSTGRRRMGRGRYTHLGGQTVHVRAVRRLPSYWVPHVGFGLDHLALRKDPGRGHGLAPRFVPARRPLQRERLVFFEMLRVDGVCGDVHGVFKQPVVPVDVGEEGRSSDVLQQFMFCGFVFAVSDCVGHVGVVRRLDERGALEVGRARSALHRGRVAFGVCHESGVGQKSGGQCSKSYAKDGRDGGKEGLKEECCWRRHKCVPLIILHFAFCQIFLLAAAAAVVVVPRVVCSSSSSSTTCV